MHLTKPRVGPSLPGPVLCRPLASAADNEHCKEYLYAVKLMGQAVQARKTHS
jgi:hypothetical protein